MSRNTSTHHRRTRMVRDSQLWLIRSSQKPLKRKPSVLKLQTLDFKDPQDPRQRKLNHPGSSKSRK